jgi:fructosamine-3-kinase
MRSEAGRSLAALHRIRGPQFGWQHDNFIGSSPQYNKPQRTWPLFFARQRLLPQLAMARRQGQHGKLIANGERLAEKVPALFVDHQPQPSLLHGDLWSGNAALDEKGTAGAVRSGGLFRRSRNRSGDERAVRRLSRQLPRRLPRRLAAGRRF